MLPSVKQKPLRLRPGDTIGIISPASPTRDNTTLTRAIKRINQYGYKVITSKHLNSRYGYLAGKDELRAQDLMQMFGDDTIRAIICLRGGYGGARILPYLDWNIIKNNPKLFVGFSDITTLHLAIYKYTGLVTFYGPMINSDFGKQRVIKYTNTNFWAMVTKPQNQLILTGSKTVRTVNPGLATGELVGGCLSLIVSTLGTPYEIDTENKIVFIEEVDEPPYAIDRMLTQLVLANKLQKANGIIFGRCKNCAPRPDRSVYTSSFTLSDIVYQLVKPLGKPTVLEFPFGHYPNKLTIPIGIKASLDARKGTLQLTEPVVI